MAGDSGGPEIEAELVDPHVSGGGVALQVGIQHHVELLAALRSREAESRELDDTLHGSRAGAAGDRCAELRIEVGVQRSRFQADVLAGERPQRPDVDGRIDVEGDAGRRRRERDRQGRRLHPDLEVLLVGENGGLEQHLQGLSRAEVVDLDVEMLDSQLLCPARRLVDERDLSFAQRRVVDAEEREVGLLLVLRLLFGALGELVLEALQIRRAIGEALDVDRQALHFRRMDLYALAAGEERAQQRHAHFDALEGHERHVLARGRADLDVGHAYAEPGEELRRHAADLHRPSPLLR